MSSPQKLDPRDVRAVRGPSGAVRDPCDIRAVSFQGGQQEDANANANGADGFEIRKRRK
jgi:hypothetical protein